MRVLANEARDDAFTIGLNGLITSWDGKDDAGMPAAAGKYFVRGFSVGDIEVEGFAFHGNDWFDGEQPLAVREQRSLRLDGAELVVEVALADGTTGTIRLKPDTGERTFAPGEISATPQHEAPGSGGSTWKIEDGAVAQRKGDEILRQLAIAEGEPQPYAIAAATDREELYLLERGPRGARLRGLRLKEVKTETDGKAVSEWEVFVEKQIAAQDTFEQAAAALGRTPPPTPTDKLRVALVPNELLQVAPAAVNLSVAFDEKGSFLRTADGLPLRRVSATPNLKWAVLVNEPNGVSLFQSNGAVSEEYHLRKLNQMMAFDAGDYEWADAK
jgi:hypothetical protein